MSFHELYARIDAIRTLLGQSHAAKRLPDEREAEAKRIRLETYTTSELRVAGFNKIRDRYAAEERRQGEIARDRELKRIAVELDRLRADLPELAIAARFDLLDTVRSFR